ncbi:MAG: NTP transferase domain-containing protein [PVC group bacterium]
MPASNSSTACVILAAGESKRMKSSVSKVAHRLGGVPLILHVLNAVEDLVTDRIVVVISPGDGLIPRLVGDRARTAVQPELLGTGHALMQARPVLADFSGDLFVLCGDVPLITPETLRKLLAFHRSESLDATILSARLMDPTGYGRIIRRSGERVARIVEEADAGFSEKVVEEVNSGSYCLRARDLWGLLEEIGNRNRQGEYYLTDLIGLLAKSGRPVGAYRTEDADEIRGINTRRQLAEAEKIFQRRAVRKLQEAGVSVVSPEMTDIEAGVEVGPDSVIYPFTVIGQGTRIGRDCRIGPFAHLLPGSIVPDGAEIRGTSEFSRHPSGSR